MAKTVSEAHDRFPRFTQERCAFIIFAPGLLRIGGAAYFVWAYPPNLESELDFGLPAWKISDLTGCEFCKRTASDNPF
jgi:hypothetical protein